MLKKIKEMKKVGKVKEVQEELVEKSAEEKELEIKLKKKKLIIRTAVMWGLVVIFGLLYHRAEVRANNPEIVFTRTDEAPKNLKDKIYIFYPENGKITNTEIEIPKVKTRDELLSATAEQIVNKLETIGAAPKIQMKDVTYYIVDKKIYLDLPEKIFENVKDARTELLILYSFVNSFTNIEGVESVRFLINNADLEKVKYANLMRDYSYKKSI